MAKQKVQFTGVNKEILKWKSRTTAALKSQIGMLTSEGKGKLISSLRGYVDHDPNGTIYRVAWKFAKHGIFLIQGTGRGYVLEDGKVIRAVRRNNAIYRINKKIERHPKDWFNPVIEARIQELSQKVSQYYADKAAEQIESIYASGTQRNYKI